MTSIRVREELVEANRLVTSAAASLLATRQHSLASFVRAFGALGKRREARRRPSREAPTPARADARESRRDRRAGEHGGRLRLKGMLSRNNARAAQRCFPAPFVPLPFPTTAWLTAPGSLTEPCPRPLPGFRPAASPPTAARCAQRKTSAATPFERSGHRAARCEYRASVFAPGAVGVRSASGGLRDCSGTVNGGTSSAYSSRSDAREGARLPREGDGQLPPPRSSGAQEGNRAGTQGRLQLDRMMMAPNGFFWLAA